MHKRERMIAIESLVEEKLKEAAKDKDRFHYDAINWGDLHCVNVESVEALHDPSDTAFRVYIEELDPACRTLREFLEAALDEAGFEGVDIHMEW